ncbi:MAG: hypothetical protein J6P07_01295 [Spirochaetaceae bacterium]|nr:hypothetical protein [Spirochaetaceae bacterium]MBO7731871.1 hypothetical protein [Methanobrevibacter sp.]
MKKIKIEANIRMSLEILVDKIDTLGEFKFDNAGDNRELDISKESARTFLEYGTLEEGSYIPVEVFNQLDLIETEYDPAQVRFDWDDSLKGKVAAFADDIDELKENINRDNSDFIGVISKNPQPNASLPFVCNDRFKYRFVYLLEKDLEVKQ